MARRLGAEFPNSLEISAIEDQQRKRTGGLGFLLASEEHRQQIELLAAHGVTPALVALLAGDRKSSARTVLPHGRTWPTLELATAVGHA